MDINKDDEYVNGAIVEAYTGEVETTVLALAKKKNMTYLEAFDHVFESNTYKRKDILENDLRIPGVRQLEIANGFIKAIELSDDSVNLLDKIANDAGIEDSRRGLRKDRHKLKLEGTFDAVVAFGGSLLRYLEGIQFSVTPEELIILQTDALTALTLALVDLRTTNGNGKTRILQGYQALVSKMCELDAPIKNTLIVKPNKPMQIKETNVHKNFVQNLYADKLARIMENIKSTQFDVQQVQSSSSLPKIIQRDICGPFQVAIGGAGHMQMCPNEEKTHIQRYHRCAICYQKHAAYNCPWLRCMMRLTPYQQYLFTKSYQDKRLPPPQRRGPYNSRGRGGGRGRGRGNGNNNYTQGTPNTPKNPKNDKNKGK